MTPLVAVTTTINPEGGSYRRPQVVLYATYLEVLEQVGLAPVLVTPVHGASSIQALVERCHGLVLSGGEDVDPARYGEEPVSELGRVCAERDAAEFAALAVALERRIPVLAICRGIQLLNVFMGGTLYQDLPTQFAGALTHAQQAAWTERTHGLRVEGGSRFAELVGTAELRINSFHHQGIKDLAPGLRVLARAQDGLIEAVEAADFPWVIGVQWHPERHEATAPETDPDRRLFAAFRREVYARAERR